MTFLLSIVFGALFVCILSLCFPALFDVRELLHIRPAHVALPPVTVRYGQGGFTPSVTTIPVGTRVIFLSATTTPLAVVSDPYPTGTDYPELGDGIYLAQEGTYDFTFTRVGTFGYSNRGQHSDHGIIKVYDPLHSVPDISKTIEGQEKVRNRYLAMLVPGKPSSIYTVFDAIASDTPFSLNCHEVGHDIGHSAYELYGFSGAMTFGDVERLKHSSAEEVCAGGYIHGVVEEASLHQSDFSVHPDTLCMQVPSGDRASCFHGVGHALMFTYARDASSSLEVCRSLPETGYHVRCYEGVWMEFFWGGDHEGGISTLGWDARAPLLPCIAATSDTKPACFLYSTFGYLRMHKKDYTGAIKLCTESKLSDENAGFCLKGVGLTMMTHFKAQHLEQSEQFARDLSANEKYSFYQGVLKYAVFSGIEEDKMKQSCALFVSDSAICAKVLSEGN